MIFRFGLVFVSVVSVCLTLFCVDFVFGLLRFEFAGWALFR